MSLVDPGRTDPVTAAPAASRTTVLFSLAAHVAVLAVVMVAPLLGAVALPEPPQRIAAYVKAATYAARPDPPAPATTASRAAATAAPLAAPTTAGTAAPVEAPTGIASGDPPALPAPGGGLEGVTGALFGHRPTVLGTPPLPPAPPSEPRTVRVGGDIQAPRKLRHVAPIYPTIAAQVRVTGTVIIEATINPAGEVADARVLRSVPLLDGAALEAVRQWRYAPSLLNGRPVSVLLTVTVRFAQ